MIFKPIPIIHPMDSNDIFIVTIVLFITMVIFSFTVIYTTMRTSIILNLRIKLCYICCYYMCCYTTTTQVYPPVNQTEPNTRDNSQVQIICNTIEEVGEEGEGEEEEEFSEDVGQNDNNQNNNNNV